MLARHYRPVALAALAAAAAGLAAPAAAADRVRAIEPAAQNALLGSADARLAGNKRIVFNFWAALQSGNRAAARQSLGAGCRSQLAQRTGPCLTTIAVSQTYAGRRAGRSITGLVNIIAEGDLVLLQTLNAVADPNDPTVLYENVDHDVFRLKAGKIVQHWGSLRITPADIAAAKAKGPGGLPAGMPAGGSPDAVPIAEQAGLLASSDQKLAAAKRAAFDFWRTVLVAGHMERTPDLMTEGYIQHNPVVASGRKAFIDMFSQMFPRLPDVPVGVDGLAHLVAEGDLVGLVFSREEPEGKLVTFDVFRVEGGKVAEHWDSGRSASEVGVRKRGQDLLAPLGGGAAHTQSADRGN